MKGFFRNYNNILTELLPLYQQTYNLLDADFLLTWNDLVSPNKENVRLAQKHGKPAIIMEHGMKAVSDYEKDLSDTVLNMGGRPFVADHMMLWGDKSKEIMLDAGVPEDKLTVVGSPIIRDYNYKYVSQEGVEKIVPFNAGGVVIDPLTTVKWELKSCSISIPRIKRDEITGRPEGNLVIFMPYHDWRKEGLEKTKMIWDKIKDFPNVLVSASSAYQNTRDDNPFKELMEIEKYEDRIQKILMSDIRKPSNMNLVKELFKKAKLVVTTIPGTINGVAWAMDVPIVVPLIDWNWRKDNNVIYDTWPADYQCELDSLTSVMESILDNDTKEDERLHYAKYFMGIDKGNPAQNMKDVIDKIVLK